MQVLTTGRWTMGQQHNWRKYLGILTTTASCLVTTSVHGANWIHIGNLETYQVYADASREVVDSQAATWTAPIKIVEENLAIPGQLSIDCRNSIYQTNIPGEINPWLSISNLDSPEGFVASHVCLKQGGMISTMALKLRKS